MMSTPKFTIFPKIDQGLAQYYKSLNKPYFNDNGQGKFLLFCEAEDFNEEDVEEELVKSGYDNCSYLDFDEDFPFDPESECSMNEEQKQRKTFQLLKQLYLNTINVDDDDVDADTKRDDSDPVFLFNDHVQNLCHDIIRFLNQKLPKETVQTVVNQLKLVIDEQQYETIEDIKDDIMDENGSLILEMLSEDERLSSYEQIIESWIKHSVTGRIDINITNFIWDVRFDDDLIQNTIQLLKKECVCIFRHPESPQNGGIRESDDVNLCIAKSIDIKNNHPILLWFVDTFCRYRMHKHRQNMLNNIPIHKDDVAVNYDISKWFENDNNFTKYLIQTYPQMSEIIKVAMASLCRRSLPIFNFQAKIFATLCDSLSMFAKYTLVFHRFCHQLQALSKRKYPFLPVQFDLLLIPQCVYRQPQNIPFEIDDDDEDLLQLQSEFTEEVYHQLGKSKHYGDVQNAFWRLDKYLDAAGYVQNVDYWTLEIDDRLRASKLQNMWDAKGAQGSQKRYERYIFIIDRRNPMNLAKEAINEVAYNIDKDTSVEDGWMDTVYLIKPKYHHTISKHNQILPEQLLGLSSEYLFPNPEKKEPDNITMVEALNGYKFGLSFHLASESNGKCYFYFGPGAVRFYLDDIHWLWPRFFVGTQTLDATLHEQIENFKKNNKYFQDIGFEQFQKQTHNIY